MNDTFFNLSAEKQNAIIKACQEEFIEYGYDNSSTNRIVKKAGISKGSLFQYFSSKEDLYLFVLEQAVNANLEYILSRLDNIKGDLVDRIIGMSEIGMDYFFIDRNAFRMYLTVDMNPDPNNHVLQEILNTLLPQYMEITKKIFSDLDTSKMRMSLDQTFEFIKLPIAGYKMHFFNKSRLKQDPALLKKEFMEGIANVAQFIRHAVYVDSMEQSSHSEPIIEEKDMVLIESGLDVLYTLMSIDNEIHQTELKEIMRFLLNAGFDMENNQTRSSQGEFEHFLLQMGTLSALDKDTLHKRCQKSIQYLNQKADPVQKQKIMDYAMNIILADGKITSEEKTLMEYIASEWGINISSTLSQYEEIQQN